MSDKRAAPKPRARPRYGIADGIRDTFALAGTVLLATGCWQIYRPAGLIAGGAVLLGLAVAGRFRRGAAE